MTADFRFGTIRGWLSSLEQPASALGLADAINGVLALIGPYFKAYRGYKIRITEDGIWTIRRFNTKEGTHHEISVKFGKMK
jgi:hypothetical protein